MQDHYMVTVINPKTNEKILDGQRFMGLLYIRMVLKDYTELGWWARRQFIKRLHKTGDSSYTPRAASDRYYRIVVVTHWKRESCSSVL